MKNKAIARQYRTFFNWDAKNANTFFGLFGIEFKEHINSIIKEKEEISNYIKAFLEIGRERNRLVHQDFGNFSLEKTTEEIYELYKEAANFILFFEKELIENGK